MLPVRQAVPNVRYLRSPPAAGLPKARMPLRNWSQVALKVVKAGSSHARHAVDRELASPEIYCNHGGVSTTFQSCRSVARAHPQPREGCHLANVSLGDCAPRSRLREMHCRVIGARQ